jgi:ABC-type spermidine/putrescine transport system permease subunit I
MVHIYLPFMVMPMYSILEKLDYRLIEASYDLGASFTRTFTHVIFPLTKSGIRSGFFMVFVTSFGEYIVPTFIGGNRKFFVGSLITEYFFIGKDWHSGAAFICVSILFLFVVALLYNKILNKLIICSEDEKL